MLSERRISYQNPVEELIFPTAGMEIGSGLNAVNHGNSARAERASIGASNSAAANAQRRSVVRERELR